MLRPFPSNFSFERSAGRLATLVSVVCELETGSEVASVTLSACCCEEYLAATAATVSKSSCVKALRLPAHRDIWKRAMSGSLRYGCNRKNC